MRDVRIDYLSLDPGPFVTQRGEWYVARDVRDEFGDIDQEYLHQDGEWRTSTFTGDDSLRGGKPTGYFATEAEAKAALEKARGEVSR